MLLLKVISVEGLLVRYEAALSEMGYSVLSRLTLAKNASLIIREHEDQGLTYLEPEIITDYVQKIDNRFLNGGISRSYYNSVRRSVERFVEFVNSGNAGALPSLLRGARQKIGPEFQKIAEEFLDGEFHNNTRNDIRWVVHKYFAWLEQQGFHNLDGVGAMQIQKFLLFCSENCAKGSVHNIRIYLKKLYAYLFVAGLSEENYAELLSFKVNREKRVYPALPKADIAKLLKSIDRSTGKGKRDYAIMLLGTVLGLRACDIIALKLSDIDWVSGEIRIVQAKTANPLALPLTQDVGEALMDYILHARPNTPAQEIFLRIHAPYTPLAAAVTLGEIYRDCCIAAGLPVSKRFHDLRRSLGTSMVSNGVSVYDVAQVFGDKNVESTQPYLSADMEHLKMCALPFDGIIPG